MDKATEGRGVETLHDEPSTDAASVGSLLVSLTKELSTLRLQYGDLEARNRHLFTEMHALQHEKLELRTHAASEEQRLHQEINDLRKLVHTHLEAPGSGIVLPPPPATSPPKSSMEDQYWRKTVAEAAMQETLAKERAAALELKLSEVQARHSMAQDEVESLRSQVANARVAVVEYEDKVTRLQLENQTLRKEASKSTELLKRGQHDLASREETLNQVHTRLQQVSAHNEELVAESLRMRTLNEQLKCENDILSKAQDEIAGLKHSVNTLKGTVTAKTAEAKAFQAYGSSAREHLQSQGLMLQQHAVFESQALQVAETALVSVSRLRHLVHESRDILTNWKSETLFFLNLLKTKMSHAGQYVQMAFAEHALLRHAISHATDTNVHLHDQLWAVHRNALLICQVINPTNSSSANDVDARRVTANYLTGELLYRPESGDAIRVQVDHIFSNRAKEWLNGESIVPTVQSVLHGYNACVVTFQDQPEIERLLPDPIAPALTRPVGTSALSLVFEQLFKQCDALFGFADVHCSMSYLGVYSEVVHDLLAVDAAPVGDTVVVSTPTVVLDIRDAHDAEIAVAEGAKNFGCICETCPTMLHLTHKIVTICITVSHVFSNCTTKSKLQVVELASGMDSTVVTTWQDTDRIRATISAENSLLALTTCLADIRQQDPSFVRYHGSKLTLMLQDCISVQAKLLLLSTVRTAVDERGVRSLHMLQLFRDAVHPPLCIEDDSDISLDAYLNRVPDVYRFQVRWQGDVSASTALVCWEHELDAMKERNQSIQDSLASPAESNPCTGSPSQVVTTKTGKKIKRKSSLKSQVKRMPFR
ncbi:hypothetical protein SDRG_04088 [Saprolegnia diclina VS20]|uniref:Kinesin motor domain-containing protein n=1 Tax=Saprolegnia diclina (strain VS20) TaxID=1156394 RepID=T0QUL2_SAPDV|nr:hypothetical protein SDRG_04088 [Saprolegnia diclina VS20]EQC38376.1 hypothetical protein SDRG_04088 [Saprolegnia diclina VS20]|eukprot:XP_008607968.1 hypothetical protein SDRG_04088 [Saprolegnia diclina VS20]